MDIRFKGFLCFGILLLSIQAFSEDYTFLVPLRMDQEAFIYENRVNLRAEPSLDAEKVGLALLGDKVEIMGKTNKIDNLYGLTAHWYKILWKNKACYVWGGLLGTMGLKGDFDYDRQSELLLGQVRTKKEQFETIDYIEELSGYDVESRMKLCRNGKVINADPLKYISERDFTYLTIKTCYGFTPKVDILYLSHTSKTQGHISHDYKLCYLKEGYLHLITTVEKSESDDVGVSVETAITFPAELKKPNHLLIRATLSEIYYGPESPKGTTEERVIRNELYYWDGKKFSLVKEGE